MEKKYATLRMVRPVAWAGRALPYRVLVDGDEVGTVRVRESRDFAVPAGKHRVQVMLTRRRGSEEWTLRLEAGELGGFVCQPTNGGALSTRRTVPVIRLTPLSEHEEEERGQRLRSFFRGPSRGVAYFWIAFVAVVLVWWLIVLVWWVVR